VKTRELKCFTCGRTWEEPVRPGARPWECPTCNPQAAKRREAERERAARKGAAKQQELKASEVEVPPFLRDTVQAIVRRAADHPQPGREELARQVRAVAHAQGHLELREQLTCLASLCTTWAAWLPTTIKVPDPEEVHVG
jgi:hypothetical protein